MPHMDAAAEMPGWPECPWELPPGVEARSDGTRVALVYQGMAVGFMLSAYSPSNLGELLARLGALPSSVLVPSDLAEPGGSQSPPVPGLSEASPAHFVD